MTEGFSLRWYKNLCAVWRCLQGVFHPPVITGLENIPEEGPAIICANHISSRDPLMLASCERRPIAFMGKSELFTVKPLAWLLRKIGCFPVARGEADLSSVRTALNVLRSGDLLGIFPQGHRRTKKMTGEPPMQTGIAMIALRSSSPVIPIRIEGSWKLFTRVYVTVGKPITFPDVKRVDKQAIEEVTSLIEKKIFSMTALPKQV